MSVRMRGVNHFNDAWLQKEEFKDWLLKVPGQEHCARCKLCGGNSINISSMGEAALRSHAGDKKHLKKISDLHQQSITSSFFPVETLPAKSAPLIATSSGGKTITLNYNSFAVSSEAEILWTLKTIGSHHSYKSNEDVGPLFRRMFGKCCENSVASSFSCGEQKTKYIAVFGISPYVRRNLLDFLKKVTYFVLCFDESYNKHLKKKQMDIHVRYWSGDGRVKTHYFNSAFMGHGSADVIFEHFTDLIADLSLRKVTQISMDGPSVNWKFYRLMDKELETKTNHNLLNVGSCGLHVVHNSFKSGCVESMWDLDDYLSSLYYLFEESPARREDFLNASNKDPNLLFPLKFVKHRWLENIPAAERALTLLPFIKNYIKGIESDKYKKPTCKSYGVIAHMMKDKLLEAKLQSFVSIARVLQPFLLKYQTDSPMLFFLADDLREVLTLLMSRFIKPQVLKENDTLYKLLQVDLKKGENKLPHAKVDVGFAAGKLLRELEKKNRITEKEYFKFINNCVSFYTGVLSKIVEKSPISYSFVRNLSCLNPKNMVKVDGEEVCTRKMRLILKALVDKNFLQDSDCDTILAEFKKYFEDVVSQQKLKFSSFDPSRARIDEFYKETMDSDSFKNLWRKVVMVLLLLSHGQASVERGFSYNKKLEVEHLHQESYIAQRYIVELMKDLGKTDLANFIITKELKQFVSGARSRYDAYLANQRKEKQISEADKKKQEERNAVNELKKVKRQLEGEILDLTQNADRLADEAEKKRSFQLVTQSNSFRQSAKKKKLELTEIDKQIYEATHKI